MSEVEVVYNRLLYAYRKECGDHGPGSTLARDISTAITVIETLWPDDVKRFNEKFA